MFLKVTVRKEPICINLNAIVSVQRSELRNGEQLAIVTYGLADCRKVELDQTYEDVMTLIESFYKPIVVEDYGLDKTSS